MPVAVGRRRRTPPAPLRRALASRDGGCRFPGCGARRFLHAHHIQHWGHDGETEPDNLVTLWSSKHHRLVHEGGFSVEGTPGNWVFRHRDGRRVETRPSTVEPLRGGRAEADARLGLDLDPDAGECRWGGENLDLYCATAGLWGLDHQTQPHQAA